MVDEAHPRGHQKGSGGAGDDRLPQTGTLRARSEVLWRSTSIERIGNLIEYDLPSLLQAGKLGAR